MNRYKNLILKKYIKGYIYIILVREYGKNNEYIIKIGYTLQDCVFKRLNKYSYGSEVIYFFYVNDPKKLEKEIINKLSSYFTDEELQKLQKMYGKEYFEMEPYQLYKIVYDIVKDHIIDEIDIINYIQNNKFNKLSLFFNENINNKLYDIFIKKQIDYTYNNRVMIFNEIKNNISNKKDFNIFNLIENKEDVSKEEGILKKEVLKEKVKNNHDNLVYKVFICHYCCNYLTNNKKDMKKHFQRINKCIHITLYNYEEALLLSSTKIFIFDFDYTELIQDDYIYIVNNYNDRENIINKNFYKKNEKNEYEINQNEINQNEINQNEINQNEINQNEINQNEKNEYEINQDEIINNSNNKKNNKISNKVIEFDNKYFNTTKNKYVCDKCNSEYTTKQNFVKHLLNIKNCERQQTINKLLNEYNQYNTKYEKKEEFNEMFFNKELQKYVCPECNLKYTTKYNFVNHLNNEDACKKQQNLNNIMEKTKDNLKKENNNIPIFTINDFVSDNYDLSHIKDSLYENKDFFIYSNFLNIILENKKNHNLFFIDEHAIYYNDNEFSRMDADKAGYMILDKLSKSFDELIYKQYSNTHEYYKFIKKYDDIKKYYDILKKNYKYNTIFTEYDIDKYQFYNIYQDDIYKSRDKYLPKIITIVNNFSNNIRKNMNIHQYDVRIISKINPDIDGFSLT